MKNDWKNKSDPLVIREVKHFILKLKPKVSEDKSSRVSLSHQSPSRVSATNRVTYLLNMWEDDDFCEDDGTAMESAEFGKISYKLGNDGYRIGKGKEEERLMQTGFDIGFLRGMQLGKLCGSLFATVRIAANKQPDSTKNNAIHIAHLQSLLFEDLPEKKRTTSEILQNISDTLVTISVDLLVVFEEFQKSVNDLDISV